MEKWTREFPSKSGYYWVYGYIWELKGMGDHKKSLRIMQVERIGKSRIIRMCDGNFIYEKDIEDAMFLKFKKPNLPR